MRRPVSTTPMWMSASPLAIVAAIALSASLSAQAQSFSQSGANSTSPNNLLPFPGTPIALDFTGDNVFIGNSAPGSFSALAGAVFKADQLSIGNGGAGTGSVTASGAGTRFELLGTVGHRLEIGSWGVGTLTVSAGALVDATLNTAGCLGGNCNTMLGNGAGSTATLTITGIGSEVRTIRNFLVGQSSVFTQPPNGFVFGTPGGTTNAFVNVLAGGTLRTEGATVGNNNATPNGNGSEKANGTVVVDGAGSQWVVKHNSIDNAATGMLLGFNVGGQGSLTISGGGSVLLDATNGLVGAGDYVNIGQNGGKGALTVTGAGSSIVLARGGVIQAGRSNSAGGIVGEGSFSVLAGASASATFLNVGRAGSTGTALIDGTGSQLVLSGMGQWSSGGIGPAGSIVGWGGSGQVTVANGALWRVTDGGADTSTGPGSPAITVGDAGGNGKLFIQSGSLVEILSTSISPAPGGADNFNPYLAVGRSGGTGELTINGGGRLLLTGNAPVQAGSNRTTTLNIGGDSDTAAGGTGTVNVSGLGSEIRVAGADALVIVGRNGTGALSLSNQALLATTVMLVGRAASGNGTLTMDNSVLDLSGQWTSNPSTGAGLTIGHLGGTGVASITNNSLVTITNLGSAGASLNLGGTSASPLGHGELTLDGGSKINVVTAAGPASMNIGRGGSGIATVSDLGTQIDLGTGNLNLALTPTGTGTLTIGGGAKVLAGTVNLAGNGDVAGVVGGVAQLTVSGAGSELRASGPIAFIGVGRGGTGTMTVDNGGMAAATAMSIGRNGGHGTLNVNNAAIELTGQQTAGNLVGANLAIGLGGATGVANIGGGSTVNITNYTAASNVGANLVIGGSGNYPLGNGSLSLSGGSQINVLAAPGAASAATLGAVTIGNNGSGTANLSGASSINVGAGNVYVGRQVGSTGTLVMNGNSTLNAGFVGVGVGAAGLTNNTLGTAGGTGTLVLNNSTINTSRFELGAGSLLTGDGGTINAGTDGPVIIAGTISPGNSPGRIRIRCDITMLAGSQLILDIEDTGVSFDIDELIIGSTSKFDLQALQIVFNFIGATNPDEFMATGGFNLDNFLRAEVGDTTAGLSTLFNSNGNTYKDWNAALKPANFSATSAYYDLSNFKLSGDGEVVFDAAAIPEPASIALVLLALLTMTALSRRRMVRRA